MIYLVTGAGGGVAGISPQVVARPLAPWRVGRAMVHHDDARAERYVHRVPMWSSGT